MSSLPESSPTRSWVPGLLALALLATLWTIPSAGVGFWEPWETAPATLGRFLAESPDVSRFAVMRNGEIVSRPWLESLVLPLAFSWGDGSEIGFRLPLILLQLLSLVWAFHTLRGVFGAWRAALAVLLTGVCPIVFLSAFSLAGDAWFAAPLTAALATLAHMAAGRSGPGMLVLFAAFTGLTFWGRGVPGIAAPLLTAALYAVATLDHRPAASRIVAGGALALAGIGIPLVLIASGGWAAGREWLGLGAAILLPLGVILATAEAGRARFLLHPMGTAAAVGILALFVLAPLMAVVSATDWATALRHVTYPTWLTARTTADHVPFDHFIRFAGYAAFPITILVPFAYAWIMRTLPRDGAPTCDSGDAARAWKLVLALAAGVIFLTSGLSASLSGWASFPMAFVLATPVALALTDRPFLDALRRQPTTLLLIAVGSAALLAVTLKDLGGTYDMDKGRPGPHVIFESLLLDGKVAFPGDYRFNLMFAHVVLWMSAIVMLFAPPDVVLGRLSDLASARAAEIDSVRGRLHGLRARSLRVLARVLGAVARPFDALLRATGRRGGPAALGVALFTTGALTWAADLSVVELRDVSNHFSQKGILDTWERLATNGEKLHTAGIPANDNSYYLGRPGIERLAKVSDVTELFCRAESRVFVIVPTDALAETYFHVRGGEGAADGRAAARNRAKGPNCPSGRDIFVVDGRSSRYTLITNRLGDGEKDESLLAANTFTMDSIPATARRFEERIVLDGRLRLVASEISPATVSSGTVKVTTYWEVLRRVSGDYEMFIHTDFGGNRINGDHKPVQGRWPTRWWVPGDIVRDDYDMKVSRADKAGTYTVWLGMFRGDDRMKLPGTTDNRINAGQLRVGR